MVKILLPLAWMYGGVMQARNRLFERGLLKQHRVQVPVISVGNLSVGGTGKTPLVEYIVGHLLQRGRRVGVISRGYARRSKGVVVVSDGKTVMADARRGGDEPVQLAEKYRSAIVVVAERRVDAAHEAIRLGADVLVMDDGFQHRYLARDLDIVVVNSMNNPVLDALLPAGRLREPITELRRAHIVALSHADEGEPEEIETALRPYFSGSFVRYCYRIREVVRASDGAVVALEAIRRMRLLAFSGVGNHEAFVHRLRREGFATLGEMRFADHHAFTEIDVHTLEAYTRALDADALITTEKDAVRLRAGGGRQLLEAVPVFFVRINVELLGGSERLHTLIHQTVGGVS